MLPPPTVAANGSAVCAGGHALRAAQQRSTTQPDSEPPRVPLMGAPHAVRVRFARAIVEGTFLVCDLEDGRRLSVPLDAIDPADLASYATDVPGASTVGG